jgi:hypothetical protein
MRGLFGKHMTEHQFQSESKLTLVHNGARDVEEVSAETLALDSRKWQE